VLRTLVAFLLLTSAAHAERFEIFGYYPYWRQSTGTAGWRWDLITTVGFFSAEMASDGSITDAHGFTGTTGTALVTEAHAHGARVVVVVTNFSADGIHAILTTGKTAAIANLVDLVDDGDGDGVNLDFEGMRGADRAAMVTFTTELGIALRARIPGAHVSLALPSVDWSDAWDVPALADTADALLIMAYDYHWRGSGQAGPVSPLTSGSLWSNYDVTQSVNYYLGELGEERRGQLVTALPLYGYDWPTVDGAVPSSARGSATARLYSGALELAALHGRGWDPDSQTPYVVYEADDGWHQLWYDDADSLALKMDLVRERGLGGIGFWALSYEANDGTDLWDTVDEHFAVAPDAGLPDAGGPELDGDGEVTGGCSVAVGGAATPWAALALGVLVLRRRRRR
jgi:MYXO-CTERM domain-containing protein